jgi:putative DNA primase/helicase
MHADLSNALARAGFDLAHVPTHPEPGRYYRFPAPGKRRGDTGGWLVLNDDTDAAFGVWGGASWKWKAGNDNQARPDPHAAERRRTAEQARREAAETAARQARWIWQNGTPCNDNDRHPYLVRKGINGDGLRTGRDGRLLVPMYRDLGGDLVGLQFIDRDGVKRFLTGTEKRGAFCIIPGTGPRIFAEGYATAETVAQATGRPVVVTFDAGNLETVAASWAEDGSAIAADNDNRVKPGAAFRRRLDTFGTGHRAAMATGLPFYLPPTGFDFNDVGADAAAAIFEAAPLSSVSAFDAWCLDRVEITGKRPEDLARALSRAASPADAAATAWTVAARLSMRAPSALSLPQIREFLDRHLPPLLAHPATLDGIVARLEAAQAHRKSRALEAVTIPADVLARHRHEKRRDLPDLSGDDWQGVIVLRAPMGAGKTQRAGQPFAAWARANGLKVLAICHRVSLVAELAKRLDLTHYGDLPEEIAWAAEGLATCLPSITRPEHRAFVDHAEAVFVDEIAQVLRFLEAERHCSTRAATNADVFAKLREIVARARVVLVADAGADRRTVEFLESCRPGERFRVIEVTDPDRNGIEATYHVGAGAAGAVVGQALEELAAGGKVWLAVEGKDRTKALGRFFAEQGWRTLAIHADNKGNAAQAAFLENPEAEARAYDVVLASPVIGSGLSIEHRGAEHFTFGGFIGGGSRLTPADAAQMLRRVRYLRRFALGLLPNTTIGAQDPDAILRSWETAARIEGSARGATVFDALVAGIRAQEQNGRADFAAGLLWQLDAAGWHLERRDNGDDDGDTLAAVKAASVAEEARHRAELIAARILTQDEAAAIERKADRTEGEALLIEAHRIRQTLNVPEITEAVIDFWDRGAVVRKLDRFGAAQGIVPAHDDRSDILARRRYWKACARAYGHLFQGIDLTAGEWLTDETAGDILERVMSQRHLLAHLGIVPAKFGVWHEDRDGRLLPMAQPAYPVREVAAILERMGLSVEGRRVRRCPTCPGTILSNTAPSGTPKPKGNPRAYVYHVAPSSWQAMAEATERRNAARKVETVPMFRPAASLRIGRTLEKLPPIGAVVAALETGRLHWRQSGRARA